MKRLQNPIKLKQIYQTIPFSDMFSNDYSSLFEVQEFEKEEFLIREDEYNNYLFFLLDGSVKCFSYSLNGKSQFITYIHEQQFIGTVGSIWGEAANANIQAATPCRCLTLPLRVTRNQLLSDVKFLRLLCRQLGTTLRNNNRYLNVTHCTSIESKLASIIIASSADNVCSLNLSSTAEIIGTTYRHTLRLLSKFCSSGLLEKSGKTYIILDYTMLSLLAKDSYDFIVTENLML